MSLQVGLAFNNLVNAVSTGYGPLLRVKPGDAQNSVLYLKLIGDPSTGALMPLGGDAISVEQANLVKTWIDNGAEDN